MALVHIETLKHMWPAEPMRDRALLFLFAIAVEFPAFKMPYILG
jgi:hypothetical protein